MRGYMKVGVVKRSTLNIFVFITIIVLETSQGKLEVIASPIAYTADRWP